MMYFSCIYTVCKYVFCKNRNHISSQILPKTGIFFLKKAVSLNARLAPSCGIERQKCCYDVYQHPIQKLFTKLKMQNNSSHLLFIFVLFSPCQVSSRVNVLVCLGHRARLLQGSRRPGGTAGAGKSRGDTPSLTGSTMEWYETNKSKLNHVIIRPVAFSREKWIMVHSGLEQKQFGYLEEYLINQINRSTTFVACQISAKKAWVC